MHNHNKSSAFNILYRNFTLLLIAFFWILLIFAFDTPYTAAVTLFAAAVHEIGHKLAYLSVGEFSSLPKIRFFGFKIQSGNYSSYKNDIIGALGGPAANLFLCIIALPLMLIEKDAYFSFAVINIATAATNLLPIKGYDGYKVLHTILLSRGRGGLYINIIEVFSFVLISALTFASLYLIGKFNEGYWIFLIFFSALLTVIFKSPSLIKSENKRVF